MEPKAKARATLSEGEWFMYDIRDGINTNQVKIYSGEVQQRKHVRTISRMQALALCRWHGHDGIYNSYKDGNGRWRDVYVVGDIDAWYGEPDPEDPGEPCPKCGATIWGDWCDDCFAKENAD